MAHVPKFGNWDGDGVPYTSYFENARKGKGTAGKSFNPNDPQENPDDFLSGPFPAGNEAQKSRHDGSSEYVTSKMQQNIYGSKDDSEFNQGYMETPPRVVSNSINGNSGYKSNRSAGSTPERYRPNKPASSPRRPVLKSGRPIDAMHDIPSSVPRFGAWDDANPESGDGFTMIFNRVKQEKQIAATKAPRVPPAVPKVQPGLRSNHSKSSKSKISCCMLPPTKD